MRNATRTAVIAVSAVAAVLAVAVAAYAGAGALRGAISVTPSGGHYGDELTIAPSINTTALPGDNVDIQYLAADSTWQKYGESLSVEDTISPDPTTGMATITPLAFVLDESLTYPAVIRAVVTPKNSAEGTCATDPAWITMTKNTSTSVKITGPSSVVHGKAAEILGTVVPVSGIGSIKLTVKRLPAGATTSYTVATDESGIGTFSFKRSIKGSYRITEKFLGNKFGPASGVAAKTIVVK